MMLDVSEMIIKSANMRTESRGSHYREDFDHVNNQDWLKNIIISQEGGSMKFDVQPVDFSIQPFEEVKANE